MDSSLFDDLVRAWAAGGASRRRVLRMAAGSAVGGLAGWPDHRPADARTRQQCKKIKNKRRRKKCLKSLDSAPLSSACAIASDCPAPTSACDVATCADGACGTTPRICDDGVACTADACDEGSGGCTHIPDNQLCGDDRFCDPVQGCVCLTHLTPCGDSCFQPGSSCDTGQLGECATGVQACQGTDIVCVTEHTPVAEACNGLDDDCDGEVDEGAVCPGAPNAQGVCEEGACAIVCQAGWFDCDGILANGCEVNGSTNSLHCGGCNRPCIGSCAGGTNVCQGGKCVCQT